jgi:hypothetical protein
MSYVPKQLKPVILISSNHFSNEIPADNENKPQMICDYNKTKGGVDLLDKMAKTYTVKRGTRRWPLAVS